MTTNKIINKRLLPKTLITGILTLVLLAPATYGAVNEIKQQQANTIGLLVGAMAIFIILALLYTQRIEAYENHYKAASRIARKYLKQQAQTRPELKQFEAVLNNPRALKAVATMISNSMTESETKQISHIIFELSQYYYKTKKDTFVALKDAEDEIIKIVNEHASVHPEFIQEVMIAMARADSTYVVPTQQHTR